VTNATGNDLSQIALEKCGDYRVLRRLVPRDVNTPVPVDEQIKIGVLLDVETTGLDVKTDEVIELRMVKFACCPDGRMSSR
jgi:DNA polymerase-3 subunit epsilon